MKVPMKWLREYVDIKMGGEEYASKMIMTGTAVEGVEKTGTQFDKVVVGKVITLPTTTLSNCVPVFSTPSTAVPVIIILEAYSSPPILISTYSRSHFIGTFIIYSALPSH